MASETEPMNVIRHLRHRLAIRAREREAYAGLTRLADRDLADIGLSRSDIREVARAAARQGPVDVFAFGGARRPSRVDTGVAWLTGRGLGLRTV
jgi:uncharacterized protein YjiS (DUF1127 family)